MVFGYKKNEIGETSEWWFDRIHPEDSLKMSVKLYSFIEKHDEGTAQRWLDQNNDLFNLILNNKNFETDEEDPDYYNDIFYLEEDIDYPMFQKRCEFIYEIFPLLYFCFAILVNGLF